MPRIMLIDEDISFQNMLTAEFQRLENEFRVAIPGDDALTLYQNYLPDLVLINYANCLATADKMFEQILDFDSTACIIGLLNESVLDQVHRLYLKGARSTIEVPNMLKTEHDVQIVMNQLFKVCDDLNFDECVGCWKQNTFVTTIKF